MSHPIYKWLHGDVSAVDVKVLPDPLLEIAIQGPSYPQLTKMVAMTELQRRRPGPWAADERDTRPVRGAPHADGISSQARRADGISSRALSVVAVSTSDERVALCEGG